MVSDQYARRDRSDRIGDRDRERSERSGHESRSHRVGVRLDLPKGLKDVTTEAIRSAFNSDASCIKDIRHCKNLRDQPFVYVNFKRESPDGLESKYRGTPVGILFRGQRHEVYVFDERTMGVKMQLPEALLKLKDTDLRMLLMNTYPTAVDAAVRRQGDGTMHVFVNFRSPQDADAVRAKGEISVETSLAPGPQKVRGLPKLNPFSYGDRERGDRGDRDRGYNSSGGYNSSAGGYNSNSSNNNEGPNGFHQSRENGIWRGSYTNGKRRSYQSPIPNGVTENGGAQDDEWATKPEDEWASKSAAAAAEADMGVKAEPTVEAEEEAEDAYDKVDIQKVTDTEGEIVEEVHADEGYADGDADVDAVHDFDEEEVERSQQNEEGSVRIDVDEVENVNEEIDDGTLENQGSAGDSNRAVDSSTIDSHGGYSDDGFFVEPQMSEDYRHHQTFQPGHGAQHQQMLMPPANVSPITPPGLSEITPVLRPSAAEFIPSQKMSTWMPEKSIPHHPSHPQMPVHHQHQPALQYALHPAHPCTVALRLPADLMDTIGGASFLDMYPTATRVALKTSVAGTLLNGHSGHDMSGISIPPSPTSLGQQNEIVRLDDGMKQYETVVKLSFVSGMDAVRSCGAGMLIRGQVVAFTPAEPDDDITGMLSFNGLRVHLPAEFEAEVLASDILDLLEPFGHAVASVTVRTDRAFVGLPPPPPTITVYFADAASVSAMQGTSITMRGHNIILASTVMNELTAEIPQELQQTMSESALLRIIPKLFPFDAVASVRIEAIPTSPAQPQMNLTPSASDSTIATLSSATGYSEKAKKTAKAKAQKNLTSPSANSSASSTATVVPSKSARGVVIRFSNQAVADLWRMKTVKLGGCEVQLKMPAPAIPVYGPASSVLDKGNVWGNELSA
ncbi:hypothetical protein HK101_009965 [Irineochytrium annulatum]|nr:hypothetical protein HK101_009965 [Irineochytrium annulatum]